MQTYRMRFVTFVMQAIIINVSDTNLQRSVLNFFDIIVV